MAAAAVRHLRSTGALAAAAPPAAGTPAAGARPSLRAVRDGERAPLDPAEFRAVLGHFASGVTIITAPGGPAGPAGFACQSFASLSLDPPLVVFMAGRTSATWPRIARAGVFCVNVLGAGQAALCRAFAVSGADKFAGVRHTPAPVTGSPRLADVPAWIDCAVHAVHTGGDHHIVVGRVEALGTDPAAAAQGPLLFHRGAFGRFEG
ncbi:flavin reductase family protein [Streptomyces sp. RS10V-4]|uniref:flavin reductase family protein n=1 Tax=Streptomyces rhizoryzae TaxID=2932493 RepID=UPI002003C8F3|nr:flavin reductase family protein [Streptomyces rhizoryzae]MCK7626286.1 flavin reductase family protein [Streptomyces rhizoryzae]